LRALITGIGGFAGSHLAEHLLASGDEVLGCNRHGKWPDDPPRQLQNTAGVFAWDITGPASAAANWLCSDFAPQWVFHLAAMSLPSECGESEPTRAAWRVNVEGTEHVIDLVTRLASRPRLLLASTSRVYSSAGEEGRPVAETAPIAPQNGYAKSKRAAEERLLQAVQADVVDGVVIRAFNHTGPRQSPKLMLPQWCEQLARTPSETPLEIYTRDAFLDLLDVRDVVRAYRQLAEHASRGEIYNVGSGTAIRSGDVAEQLLQVAGESREIRETQPGRRVNAIADITKLTELTCWSPTVPREATLRDTLDYWRGRYASRNSGP